MAAEPEIEAVREALADFIGTQIAAIFPQAKVLSDWPTGSVLPELAIAILATGEADLFGHPPVVVSSVPGSGNDGAVTYEYGRAEGIQLELDCWAATEPKRDALAIELRRILSQPPQATLSGADDGRPRLGHRMYLSLAVPNLYGAIFTYRFTAVPNITEGAQAAQKNEWRAHWRGTADGPLYEQDTIALMKRVHVTGSLLSPGKTTGGAPIAIVRPKTQAAVIVTPAAVSLGVSGTAQLKAYALYDDGTYLDVTATAAWASDSTGIATVSAGLITGVSAGAANITAISGPFQAVSAATVS